MDNKNEVFLTLAKQKEALKESMKRVNEQLDAVMADIGVDQYVQDPTTLTVYKIIKPEGTFVEFKEITYKRTALEGERGGTVLSKKEALEAGFILNR